MKLFVIGSDTPCQAASEPGVTAVNIVAYKLLQGLRDLGHDIVLQLVFNRFRMMATLQASEQQALADLEGQGIVVLPPIYPHDYLRGATSTAILRRA